jgi:hypothetical protein
MLEGGFRNGALWINFSEVEGLVCEGMRDSTMRELYLLGNIEYFHTNVWEIGFLISLGAFCKKSWTMKFLNRKWNIFFSLWI